MLITCPLCDSEDISPITSIESQKLIASWDETLHIDISSCLKNVHAVKLFQCNHCQLRFFYPKSTAGGGELYKELQKFDWYYMPQKWEHKAALEDLDGCKTMLEIGCGFGDFIELAQSRNRLSATGIELSESAVQAAQRRGLPVQLLDLQDAAVRFQGSYEAVCSFQVLEHVPDTRDFLEWSCALLKPGGKLILGLPNADSFLRYQYNIMDMPPHHITRWSSKVLSYVPNILPLKLDHIKTEPLAVYHVDGYVDAYYDAVTARYPAIRRINLSKLKRGLSIFLKATGMRKMLMGQSIYACFTKV